MRSYLVLFLVVSCTLLNMVNSFCWIQPPSKLNDWSDDCYFHEWKIPNGDSLRIEMPHCWDCQCTKGTLNCCGFGRNAGVQHIEGCVQMDDPLSCGVIFVDARDPSQPCRNV